MYSGFGIVRVLCSHWVSVALNLYRLWPRSGFVQSLSLCGIRCTQALASFGSSSVQSSSLESSRRWPRSGFVQWWILCDNGALALRCFIHKCVNRYTRLTCSHSLSAWGARQIAVKYFFPAVIMSVCLTDCLSVCLCLSLSLSVCLSVCLSV